MRVEIANRVTPTLPADDDHPYRTGPWRPQFVEYDAYDLDVDGEIPTDLEGIYLRNTENPVHPSLDRLYHPFDGDGMLHMIRFSNGSAEYRNRFVRTAGLAAEAEAGGPLWSGILGGPEASLRARRLGRAHPHEGRVEHRRRRARGPGAHVLLPMRRPLRVRPADARTARRARRGTAGSRASGASPRTPRSTTQPARCSCSTTRRKRRSCTTASSTRSTSSCTGSTSRCPDRASRTTWPSPSTTRSSTTARCSGTRISSRKARTFPASGPICRRVSRSIPRRGATADIRWFEADPTYVLHWANAYEDGDEIVLDGFFQGDPAPKSAGETDPLRSARSAGSTRTACKRRSGAGA